MFPFFSSFFVWFLWFHYISFVGLLIITLYSVNFQLFITTFFPIIFIVSHYFTFTYVINVTLHGLLAYNGCLFIYTFFFKYWENNIFIYIFVTYTILPSFVTIHNSFGYYFLSASNNFFAIYFTADLVLVNFFSFHMSESVIIFPLFYKDVFFSA